MNRWIRPAFAALAACLVLGLAPGSAEARPKLIKLWLDAHGTLMNGQAAYFSNSDGPYVGYGAAVGVQVIVFEAFFDMNVFDLGRGPGEGNPTMFNMLGAGINAPVEIADKVRAFVRGNVAYTFAPYLSEFDTTGDNSGFVVRGGGGLEYVPNRFIAVGAAGYGGYHVFGTRANGDNGSHLMVQLYTRFELGL